MDSHHSGYNNIISVQTEKVNVIIKGTDSHLNNKKTIFNEKDSILGVYCSDEFDLLINNERETEVPAKKGVGYFKESLVCPLFFEQKDYEIIIKSNSEEKVEFWHDNINVRNKVTPVDEESDFLTGVINFGNEIGYSDLIIRIDNFDYLRITIEVFPTKIDYKKDYQLLIEDVTQELYSLVFDYMKKTYEGFQQDNRKKNSLVEFISIMNKIFDDFIKSIDVIMKNPHHILETVREIRPSHKIKKMDISTLKWIEKHPDQVKRVDNKYRVQKALAVDKKITFNTKENQFTKFILKNTVKKLEEFNKNYRKLQRKQDPEVIKAISDMIKAINRRCNNSFLSEVEDNNEFASMSLVFSMAPGYRDLYKYYLMLSHGLSITGDVFNASIKELSLLYEYWCFIKLNRIMREKYELISDDFIKVQKNGIFVSLIKGRESKLKYRNTVNNDVITLAYNPQRVAIPTVTQKPDNVLSLEKKTINREKESVKYEYVFDAKYRINPANEGTDYYNRISHTPGPEVDDINTMHRYRDAIVYSNNNVNYKHEMFGAYVLFPYDNEEEYKEHKFFKSIDSVNIGGLPFLPSTTSMVEEMLEDLIFDSPDSAFERTVLPRGIEKKLAKVDWSNKDVLVGGLLKKEHLSMFLTQKFYVIPKNKIKSSCFPIHYVAINQPSSIIGEESRIECYGEVKNVKIVEGKDIERMSLGSKTRYYYFEIKEWKQIKPITGSDKNKLPVLTNMFLVNNCIDLEGLTIKTEEEFRLYTEIKRIANDKRVINNKTKGFQYKDIELKLEDGYLIILNKQKIIEKYSIDEFKKQPGKIMKKIAKDNHLMGYFSRT